MLATLRIRELPGCDCKGYARQMDRWGVDGCRQHFDEIVAHFRQYAAKYDWATKLKAAAMAAATGLAFKLNWLDPFPDLVNEAIRRAEAEQTARRRRLAILTPILGYGGTERWTVELIQAIRDEWDIEVGVLIVDDESPRGAVDAIRDLCPVSFLTLEQFPAWCRQFDAIKSWGLSKLPDVVKGYAGPVIATSHGEDLVWTKRWIDHSKRAVTHWTAVSPAAVAPLKAAGIADDRITVIYNAVDAERCRPTRPRDETRAALGIKPGEYVVGYLGRLSLEKRVPVIADAVGLLAGDYRGLVVGDGNWLKKINWHGGRVVIRPHTFEIGNVLAAMDCLVGLCDHEGFWRVGVEAALAGVPLVSTRVGILREIAEEHGVLWEEVPAGIDTAGLAKAIKRLRATTHWAAGGEPGRVTRLRAVAQTYSMERFGRAWKDLLGRLVTK